MSCKRGQNFFNDVYPLGSRVRTPKDGRNSQPGPIRSRVLPQAGRSVVVSKQGHGPTPYLVVGWELPRPTRITPSGMWLLGVLRATGSGRRVSFTSRRRLGTGETFDLLIG